ncbi:MAG: hypothetical protein V3T70_02550, partial [Phycisphaerae bacterium]
ETVGPTVADPNPEVSGGWFVKAFRLADVAGLNARTTQFRIRFSASDLINGSLVEAGVDALKVIACAVPCVTADGDMNGDAGTDGEDIDLFVAALISGETNPAIVCPGDFDDSGLIDPADVPDMVNALLN